jgi:tetratricopeptide (TPR) repeat protein
MKNGDAQQAIGLFQEAVKENPAHAKAHQGLGTAYARRGDIQQAKQEFSESSKPSRIPGNPAGVGRAPPAVQGAGSRVGGGPHRADRPAEASGCVAGFRRRLLASGKPKEALAQYDALIAAAPKSSAGYYRKGIAYRSMNKPADAEVQFRNALDRAPGSPDVLGQLVALLFQRNDRPAAVRLVESQIEKAEKKGPLHALLGTIYVSMNEPAKAEAAYKQAIDLDKNLLAAYAALGQLYARQHDPEKVIGQYRAMIAAAPTMPVPHMLLGMVRIPKAGRRRHGRVRTGAQTRLALRPPPTISRGCMRSAARTSTWH